MKLAEVLDDRASFRCYCGFLEQMRRPSGQHSCAFARIWSPISWIDRCSRLWQRNSHVGRCDYHYLPSFKAHVGADADTALVEEVSVTSANINDDKAGSEALPENPGEVFADRA